MNGDSATTGLAALRLGVGTLAWAAPNLAGRAFGLDPAANPQAPYLARLFGIRDVALAAGALASQGEARRTWLRAGLMCDAADTAAAVFGGRRGYLPKATTLLLAAPAVAAVGMGLAALRGGGDSEVATAA